MVAIVGDYKSLGFNNTNLNRNFVFWYEVSNVTRWLRSNVVKSLFSANQNYSIRFFLFRNYGEV